MVKVYVIQYMNEKRGSDCEIISTEHGVLGLCRTYDEGLQYLRKFFNADYGMEAEAKKSLRQTETNYSSCDAVARVFKKFDNGESFEEVLTLSEFEIELGDNPIDDICNLRFG